MRDLLISPEIAVELAQRSYAEPVMCYLMVYTYRLRGVDVLPLQQFPDERLRAAVQSKQRNQHNRL